MLAFYGENPLVPNLSYLQFNTTCVCIVNEPNDANSDIYTTIIDLLKFVVGGFI